MPVSMPKKKILFLMSDTGGGHRASARAIKEAIEYLYPDSFETVIEDVWSHHMPWPIRLMPDTYCWMTGPGKPLWAMLWKLTSYQSLQNAMFGFFLPWSSPVSPATLDRSSRIYAYPSIL